MWNRNLLLSVLAAAGLASLPILIVLTYFVMIDTTGFATELAAGGAIVPAILMLLAVIYAVLGSAWSAIAGTFARGIRRDFALTAIATGMVAAFLALIPWLFWLRSSGWPLAAVGTYAALLMCVAALWLLLMPGALLQSRMLDGMQ